MNYWTKKAHSPLFDMLNVYFSPIFSFLLLIEVYIYHIVGELYGNQQNATMMVYSP